LLALAVTAVAAYSLSGSVHGPALSEVEGPALSEVEGPALSEVEGTSGPGDAALLADVCGDQNGDSAVDISDVIIIFQIVVGQVNPSPRQKALGDLNGDKSVNVLDAVIGLQYIAGLTPAPDGCPPVVTLAVEDGNGRVGQLIPVEVALYNVTTGVSGFSLEVQVADPALARIVDVQFPDYGLSSTDPISAVDLNNVLEGAFSRGVLATLVLELLSAGETSILIAPVRIDDDTGSHIDAEIRPGSLVVGAVEQ
jgi:hypothetical protein